MRQKYLNWRTIEGYQCPLMIVLGERGMGKTFYPVLKHIKQFLDNGSLFIYLVDTDDSVKMLGSDKGAKFFNRILKFLKENPSKSNSHYYELMTQSEITTDDIANKIIGGTIIINNKSAGYILSIENFHKVKRNNFTNISAIIIDEFVPEKVDIRTLKNPYKLNNIIQSIARTDKIRLYMLGNTVSLVDPIITRFGLDNLKIGEIRRINVTNEHGTFLFGVAWRPNPKDYPVLNQEKKTSISGLFSQAIGETTLEDNKFINDLPEELKIPKKRSTSRLAICLHGNAISIRIHYAKNSTWYCLPDYGVNSRQRIAIDKRYIAPNIAYMPNWKEPLMKKYISGKMFFDSGTTFNYFKIIMGIT